MHHRHLSVLSTASSLAAPLPAVAQDKDSGLLRFLRKEGHDHGRDE